MAYDYSRRFLDRYQDLTKALEEIYNNRQTREMVFDRPDDLAIARNTINNLLASLALYYPSYRAMRQTIRTWSRYGTDERWHLYIGIPTHPIRGAVARTLVDSNAKQLADAPQVGVIRYEDNIRNTIELTRFMGWAQEKIQNPEITGIKLELPDATKAADHFSRLFDGWAARVVGDTTLLLERA